MSDTTRPPAVAVPEPASDLIDEIESTVAGWSSGAITVVDLLVAAAFVGGAILLNWGARRLSRRIARRQTGPARVAIEFSGQVIGLAALTIAGAIALQALGFGVGPVLLVVLVVVGVLALAARPVVQNLGAGLTMQLRGAFQVGDEITTNGVTGRVDDVNARAVVLITTDNQRIHVPNTDVLTNLIVNLTAFAHRRSEVTVTVWSGTALDELEREILHGLAPLPDVLSAPAPDVVVRELSDAGIVLGVRFWHASGLRDEAHAVDRVARAVAAAMSATGTPGSRSTVELAPVEAQPATGVTDSA